MNRLNPIYNNTVAFLRAAVGYYAGLKVRIKGIYTDNALAYRGKSFAAACAQLGLSHHYTRPYTPRTNGKAERFIQTALREWAYVRSYVNSYERTKAWLPWLHRYNWHRPHSALQHHPPISKLNLTMNNLLSLHS